MTIDSYKQTQIFYSDIVDMSKCCLFLWTVHKFRDGWQPWWGYCSACDT